MQTKFNIQNTFMGCRRHLKVLGVFNLAHLPLGSMHFTVSVFQSLLGKSRKTHFSGKLWTLAFDGSFQRILWIQDANWTCKRRSGDVLFTSRFQGRTTAVNYNKTDFSEMKTQKYSLTLQQKIEYLLFASNDKIFIIILINN